MSGLHGGYATITVNPAQVLSTISVLDSGLRFSQCRAVLSHIDLREEMIRQLDAERIKPKDVVRCLKIPSPRVAEMRRRDRRVQHEEMQPLAELLGMDVGGPQQPRTYPDQQPTVSADAGETTELVQLDLSLAMGPGTFIDDFVESEMVKFDIAMLRKITRSPFERLRLVTGIGTSHEPKFHHNDQFMIDINDRQLTRIDGYYWITLHGAHALKRLRPIGKGRIQVISENPGYEPQEVDAEDIRIEGRAIWVSRGL